MDTAIIAQLGGKDKECPRGHPFCAEDCAGIREYLRGYPFLRRRRAGIRKCPRGRPFLRGRRAGIRRANNANVCFWKRIMEEE